MVDPTFRSSAWGLPEALESDLKGAKVAAVMKVRSAYESRAKETKLEFNILLALRGLYGFEC